MFTIDEIKEKSIPVAKKFGVDTLSLFGSYARGDQNENSDLDFLIDDGEVDSLFKLSGFYQALEETFGCHVDVISSGINNQEFLKEIRKDAKVIYARER